MRDTAFGENIVSFKVWSLSGQVVFATDERLVGRSYPVTNHLSEAVAGEVVAEMSGLEDEENQYEREQWSKLLETYAPVRSSETGEVIAVSEFYQLPDEVVGAVRSSQAQGWLIVGVATLVMFLVLNGMVRQAAGTIRRQSDRLEGLNRRLRDASSSKVQTEEQVMTRLAQELHDGPAQGLAVALLRLNALESSRSMAKKADWDLVRESVSIALADLRDLSGVIRIPELEGLGTSDVILRAVADFTRRTGRAVGCTLATSGLHLPPAVHASLYRIIQEALSNSFLHARCSQQLVSASLRGGWLEVEILDDGVGFDPNAAPAGGLARLGIRGMRERAELLGGTLHIHSEGGAGARIVVRIPTQEGALW